MFSMYRKSTQHVIDFEYHFYCPISRYGSLLQQFLSFTILPSFFVLFENLAIYFFWAISAENFMARSECGLLSVMKATIFFYLFFKIIDR